MPLAATGSLSPQNSQSLAGTEFGTYQPADRERSRYLSDFEEVRILGRGTFGQVAKVKNKLDGRYYAVKKIMIRQGAQLNKILREVTLLSRIHHRHCLRYY